MYTSTGATDAAASAEKGTSSFRGSVNRMKYHDESTNVSIVSVSLFACPWQLGQVVLTHSSACSRGLPRLPLNQSPSSFGSFTGSWSTGTGTRSEERRVGKEC